MNLTEAIAKSFSNEIYRCILSNPAAGDRPYQKIVINRQPNGYQLEKYTNTQVFHERLATTQLVGFLTAELSGNFRQYNGWDSAREYTLRVSNKGKVLCGSSATEKSAPKAEATHNREKNYIIAEGSVIEPLVDMGIFTPEGRVVRSMYDKYRQINRFVEMIDDEVGRLDPTKPLTVIDFGCGKSYLTFVLYYYLTQLKNIPVTMIGLDLKQDVIEKCNQTARRYGYSGLRFELGNINGYQFAGKVDMVITLHACDTATDYALYNAMRWGARLIFSVPCCQHELNGQMASDKLSILTRYGIVRERTAALMTDAIRANLLESCGYRTQLLEFIDLAHTPKNILIRAVKGSKNGAAVGKALAEAEALMAEFHLQPTLYSLIKKTPEA